MVIRNIAHVMFGYPARKPNPEGKKNTAQTEKPSLKPEKEQLPPQPKPLPLDDIEGAAEALLTAVEIAQKKGSNAAASPLAPASGLPAPAVTGKKRENAPADNAKQEPSLEAEASKNPSTEGETQKDNNNGDDLLSDLFKQETAKKDTPIDLLTNSVPPISMQELIYQTKELNDLISQRQKRKR